MAYITVDVEVDLYNFDDQELIDELETRGWYVGEQKGVKPDEQLTLEEKDVILNLFARANPGSIEYNIYEKLRKK